MTQRPRHIILAKNPRAWQSFFSVDTQPEAVVKYDTRWMLVALYLVVYLVLLAGMAGTMGLSSAMVVPSMLVVFIICSPLCIGRMILGFLPDRLVWKAGWLTPKIQVFRSDLRTARIHEPKTGRYRLLLLLANGSEEFLATDTDRNRIKWLAQAVEEWRLSGMIDEHAARQATHTEPNNT